MLEALRQELPGAQLQRCTVHKVRGFERYLREGLPAHDAAEHALSLDQAQARHHAMKTEVLAIFAPGRSESPQRAPAL